MSDYSMALHEQQKHGPKICVIGPLRIEIDIMHDAIRQKV
jgi:hypothetical protein